MTKMLVRASKRLFFGLAFVSTALGSSVALAATLEVGPGKPYAKPCEAIAASSDNDVIEIDASGSYAGDVCAWSKNGLVLRGVGAGRAKIDAAGQNSQGKAIWVIAGSDTTLENIELSGATAPDQNGAGIRQEGKNLTVRNCFFHDNEDGILAGNNAESTILIEHSEFANNGFGDGQSHNLYINHVGKLIFQFNYSHHAKIGHLLKSRATENHVLYNRLTGEDGTDSYEIDLPNGGLSFVIGNLIQQGPNTDNSSIISYRREGADPANPSNALFIVNNTFVNERPNGGTFLNIDPGVAEAVVVSNNIFVGPGTISTQANSSMNANFQGDPGFVDQAAFDYHLKPGSAAVDMGMPPGTGGGIDLTPKYHYVHPASSTGRMSVGTIDIGAYELGGDSGSGGAGGSGSGGGSASGGGSGGASAGEGGGGGGAAGEDGSCGCRVVGAVETRPSFAVLALVGLIGLRRSRRQARPLHER